MPCSLDTQICIKNSSIILPPSAASMGMMGSLGMMGGNPLATTQGMMQSMLAMRSPSLDMNNPVLAQLMMQQVSSRCYKQNIE